MDEQLHLTSWRLGRYLCVDENEISGRRYDGEMSKPTRKKSVYEAITNGLEK